MNYTDNGDHLAYTRITTNIPKIDSIYNFKHYDRMNLISTLP